MLQELERELDELLKKHPHLLDLQFKLSKNLAKFDTVEDRLYYINIELLDSFYELNDELAKLDRVLKELV